MLALKRIRIETAARLHFGLLDTAPPFGGLGVMIDQPSTIVEILPASEFGVEGAIEDGTYKDRAVMIAKRFCQLTDRSCLPSASVHIIQTAPPHSGFGSGTQLSLCIAEGLRQWTGETFSDETLATQIADRGKRSAVGVHGFFHGGLIFETGGKDASQAGLKLNPIERRVKLPDQWRLLTLRPIGDATRVYGTNESNQFARLQSTENRHRDELQKRITDEILPAAESEDFATFASSVASYNHASGMLFAAAQGGPYNGRWVTELIESLRQAGAVGVGQSSWGPGVFAWCQDEPTANALAATFQSSSIETQIARVKHEGRRVQVQNA